MLKHVQHQDELLHQIADCFRDGLDLRASLQRITEYVRSFLDVDRVKIYQFSPDDSGQVIAEARADERLPSLLGLHFPASDVPPQARAIFLKARQRVIVDLLSKKKTLIASGTQKTRIKLSSDDIRYAPVDPCHIQYLLSMGVLSSLTVPIVHQGSLWGLCVSHHSDPHHFSEQELQTVQLWVNQISVALSQHNLVQQVQQQAQQEVLLQTLTNLMGQQVPAAENWVLILEKLAEAFSAQGCRLHLLPNVLEDGATTFTYGVQPAVGNLEESSLWPILCAALEPFKELETEPTHPLVETEPASEEPGYLPLPHVLTDWRQDECKILSSAFEEPGIESVMVVPLKARDQAVGYLMLFRQAQTVEVFWAGQKSHDPRNERPRESFAAWLEHYRQVAPWTLAELRLAQSVGLYLYMGLMQHWVSRVVHHRSSHDVLTQLPNWLLFTKQLGLALLHCLREGDVLAVGIFDLDRFKGINEAYGHTFGNYLLQNVAERLQQSLQTLAPSPLGNLPVFLARWHGDGFALLFPHVQGTADVNRLSQALVECLKNPFPLQGEEIYLTGSLGIAVAPYDGDSVDTLIQHAEIAMYQAKYLGRNTYQIYSPAMGAGSLLHQGIANDLYKALDRQEFVLYYQPQWDLKTQRVVGLEVLIRWQHPQLGLVSPGQFIPIAEETGLIKPIGEWVLQTACEQYRLWRLAGLPPVRIAVNLSASQFASDSLVPFIRQVLQEAGINPGELELEITEETAAGDMAHTVSLLNALRDLGIHISLDDFGMGYSSLSTLKHFPVDTLKIDKSFVFNATSDESDAAIVKTIVALGHGLNLKVLAEGVETNDQMDFLRRLGCDRIQGYHVCHPQPSSAIFQWLIDQFAQSSIEPSSHFLASSEALSAPEKTAVHESSRGTSMAQGGRLPQLLASAPLPAQRLDQKIINASSSELAAKILEYERLKEEMEQQLKRERLVRTITEKIRQSLDIDDILSITVNEVRYLLKTDRVILFQFNDDWTGQVVKESVAPNCLSIVGETIDEPCFRDRYVKYYRQGRVRAIDNIQEAGLAECHLNLLVSYEVKANLVVPIAYRDQLWGLLIAHHCQEPRHWSQQELELLSQVASQAAIAIHQGQLYKQLEAANHDLQQLSTQDGLTGLANRTRFDEHLRQEWQRLKRIQAPLSLILCDVDCFKLFNDTYGHPRGDQCLQQVSGILKDSACRAADLAARYGGEEFALVLPETDLEGALQVAEKIRQRLQDLSIPHHSSVHQQVTLSLGVATLVPTEQGNPQALIRVADEHLYQAKHAGRNQVCGPA
ncbi:MAG: diguanylate cyclase [Cyanobacteria bacterium Co-bin8]|nr:diguanylate cyclase [Cyanobacteria bacterium Co-bin8]